MSPVRIFWPKFIIIIIIIITIIFFALCIIKKNIFAIENIFKVFLKKEIVLKLKEM